MPRYIVQHFYKSDVATYPAGLVVELDGVTAAWFNRDSPGVLKRIEERAPEPVIEEPRAIEAPPQDRMVRKASKRRQ